MLTWILKATHHQPICMPFESGSTLVFLGAGCLPALLVLSASSIKTSCWQGLCTSTASASRSGLKWASCASSHWLNWKWHTELCSLGLSNQQTPKINKLAFPADVLCITSSEYPFSQTVLSCSRAWAISHAAPAPGASHVKDKLLARLKLSSLKCLQLRPYIGRKCLQPLAKLEKAHKIMLTWILKATHHQPI